MGSGFDPGTDHRLEQELDRILDGVNNLDLAALQPGDGLAEQKSNQESEQKSEPAPIDEANDLPSQVDPNIKAKAEAELKSTHSDMPLMMTDQVAGFINYFSNRGRGTLERALARSGRYEDMILRILNEQAIPAGSYLPGPSRIRFSSAGLFPRWSPRHVAIHGQPRGRLRTRTQLVGRRPSGP